MKLRKQLFAVLTALVLTFSVAPLTASASTCPLVPPVGTVEIAGTVSYTYTVGEAFRSREVGLNIYTSKGVQYYGDHLEFWANGNPIKNGYKFKEVGNKEIIVKRYDKQAKYVLQVTPVLKGTLKDCSLATSPAKTTYRQTVESFNPKDIVVKCTFTDGSTQDLGYKDLEFYAGARGMKTYKNGVSVKAGYRFKEAGKKDLIIRVLNKEIRVPFLVKPFSDKVTTKMELIQEPSITTYEVGEAFRADEYIVRCYFEDGTKEDFSGNKLDITANTTPIYNGYQFKEAGTKKVVITLGGYSTTCQLTVTE